MTPTAQCAYELRNSGPELTRHVAVAVARNTARGWRLDKLKSRENIDAAVALAIAVHQAENQPAPTQLLGWI